MIGESNWSIVQNTASDQSIYIYLHYLTIVTFTFSPIGAEYHKMFVVMKQIRKADPEVSVIYIQRN